MARFFLWVIFTFVKPDRFLKPVGFAKKIEIIDLKILPKKQNFLFDYEKFLGYLDL